MWIQPFHQSPFIHPAAMPLLNSLHYLTQGGVLQNEDSKIQPQTILHKQKKIQKTSLRQPIYEWFQKLSIKQRQEITQIKDQLIVNMVIQLFDHKQLGMLKVSVDGNKSKKEDNREQRKILSRMFDLRQGSQNKLRCQQELLKHIRLICLGKSSLFLDSSFLEDVDNYFDCLDQISEKHIFECSKQTVKSNDKNNNKTSDNPLWFSSYSFNTLGQWISSSIQKLMISRYQQKAVCMNSPQNIIISTSEIFISQFIEFCEKNIEKDKHFKDKYFQNIRNWMSLCLGQKTELQIKQFQQSAYKMYELFDEQKTNQMIQNQISVKKKKSKKSKAKRQIKQSNQQIKSLQNRQTEIETVSNSRQLQDLNTTFNEIIDVEILGSSNIKLPENILIVDSKQQSQQQIGVQQVSNIEYTKCQSIQSQIKQQINNQIQIIQEIKQNNKQQSAGDTMSHSESDSIEILKRKKHHPKKKKKLSDKIAESIFESWLDHSLELFVDNLSVESNKFIQARILTFERIRHFTSALYPNKNIEGVLFGSNAVGLSLSTSDIDILLKGLQIQSQTNLFQFLEKFSNQLKKMKWVVECSIFPHAKIPIIKLLINLNYHFQDSYYFGSDQSKALQSVSAFLQQSTPIQTLISVDLTIDMKHSQYSHMGIDSTNFMRNKLELYDYLYELVMTFKYLFNRKGLNKTYKGGISSYGTLLMCVSYLKNQKPNSLGLSLLNILNFYSSLFNNDKQMISFDEQNSCFKDLILQQNQYCPTQLTLIDPLNGRSITSNCTTFTNIKYQFSRVYTQLLHVKSEMILELSKLQPAQLKPYQQKKKCVDKFIKKYQQTFKLKDILEQQ